ncbi:glycosyltransferase family 1 protein [Devosia sp. ZB163]|uniref:glycosyltransferase family 4 protein n=1 Tax=Devosia sp. ZB163 TaxID=3025938 RepID=UPI00235EB6AD|nr:glycosyltransferase family 1 protein [Devosia sp. ZB163]MDC9824323.1 glycosyltransferase family 1 protein [Devosia sp. ZB163]
MPQQPKTVLIVTDAWHPQINGVVRSIELVAREMEKRGITVKLLTPNEFKTFPMPGYGEIRLSRTLMKPVYARIEAAEADAIHIATEGPLGIIARRWCRKNGFPFSTAYHTQFPEYLKARLPVPLRWSYRFLRWFHGAATYCLVGTPHLKMLLENRGFTNAVIWQKGVDTELFNPSRRSSLPYPGPVFLYVGRVAVEKNIEAFLELDLPGTKLVVGGGPSLDKLTVDYPGVTFLGSRQGEELATLFASADVFVFPSRTDTFGLVLLEALASGTPVAAYPVTGPIDVIGDAPVGVLDHDLKAAALRALDVSREECRAYAEQFSWAASADQFISYLPTKD